MLLYYIPPEPSVQTLLSYQFVYKTDLAAGWKADKFPLTLKSSVIVLPWQWHTKKKTVLNGI